MTTETKDPIQTSMERTMTDLVAEARRQERDLVFLAIDRMVAEESRTYDQVLALTALRQLLSDVYRSGGK